MTIYLVFRLLFLGLCFLFFESMICCACILIACRDKTSSSSPLSSSSKAKSNIEITQVFRLVLCSYNTDPHQNLLFLFGIIYDDAESKIMQVEFVKF